MKSLKVNNYEALTKYVYENLSWGPLYRKKDGTKLRNTDNNSSDYIKYSLKKMNIKIAELKNKKVFNIGTGRESRFFANKGAIVTHVDISKENVLSLNKWSKKHNKKVESIAGNIENIEIGENKFDIIFLAGIYQHLEKPSNCLFKFIKSLKPKGKMYMGFYRSGEYKYFIVDAIRYILNIKEDIKQIKQISSKIKIINSIIYSLGNIKDYQTSRVLDDFFVPKKHNFHPHDIIHDVKLVGGEIYHFDNDFRNYDHKTKKYFSIGGDRIYITKKKSNRLKFGKIKNKLKTKRGRNQLLEIKYKENVIKENIKLIKKLKNKLKKKEFYKILICLSLYQFTRPFNPDESFIYQESLRKGKHESLNIFLKNCLKLI